MGFRRDPAEPTREQSTYRQLLAGRKSMGWAKVEVGESRGIVVSVEEVEDPA